MGSMEPHFCRAAFVFVANFIRLVQTSLCTLLSTLEYRHGIQHYLTEALYYRAIPYNGKIW